MVSRETDDPFHEMLVVGIGILENNNVAALQLKIGQNLFVPSARSAKNELIYQQVVADQKGAFHRSRWDLESLNDKASAKQGQNHRHEQRFQVFGQRGLVLVVLLFPLRWFVFSLCQSFFRHSASAFRFRAFYLFKSRTGRPLFGFFFPGASSCRHVLPTNPNSNLETLLVVGAAFSSDAILRRRPPLSLQKLLQRGFAIGVRDTLAALLECVLEQAPSQHFARGTQSAIEVNRSNHRFERVGQQCLFVPTAGFLFSAPQTQVLSQPQSPRGGLQRTSIDDARAAFG